MDQAKAGEGEVLVDDVEHVRLLREALGPAARRDHACRAAQLLLEAHHHPLDQADVAVKRAGLDGRHGVLAYSSLRPLELHAIELCGPFEERLGRDADAGRDRVAQVVALSRDGVEDRCRAEIDDDQRRRPVLVERGDDVDDAVGADFARVVVDDAHAGARSGADDERLDVEIAPAELLEHGREVRHDAGHDGLLDGVDRDVLGAKQADERDGVFVRQAGDIGGDAPGGTDRAAVEDADGDVGIADIEREKHASTSFRMEV